MGIKEKLTRASDFYNQQNFDAATAVLEKILAKKPELFDACRLLALTMHAKGEYESSVQLFKKVIERHPRHSESVNNLANVYQDSSQWQLAENYYLKALAINHNYSDALNNLANVQLKLRKTTEAEINYRKAISSDPTKVEYFFNLSLLLSEQGKFQEALDLQLKVLEVNANESRVYFHIFNNFMFLHRYQDALEFADIGLLSNRLNDFQLCELLIGKAILFWLFDNDEEGLQAISLSEMIHQLDNKDVNLKNHRVFHHFIKALLHYRQSNREHYDAEKKSLIYFISESHGFAPNGMLVNYQGEQHVIKSLFITGAKMFHLTGSKDHKCKSSLDILLKGLPKGSNIVLGFGEIDCRINEGILQYSAKYNKNVQDVINGMIERYIYLIESTAKLNNVNIIVYGVPAPHPFVLNTLLEEQQEVFKKLVAYFNQQLNLECKKNHIPFLDVYGLTNLNKVSNLKYHSDVFHVNPNTVPELFELLV